MVHQNFGFSLLSFQTYTDGPGGQLWKMLLNSWGLNALQSANHRDHPCDFWQSWGLSALQSANHEDHPCTFGKLGTKSKILVNHWDHQYRSVEGNLSIMENANSLFLIHKTFQIILVNITEIL
ncbi:hypothetical protein Hanom_Chr00s000002g01600711 [Helianthus anomalus]